jgi:tRNA A58 N-methylase Trm61
MSEPVAYINVEERKLEWAKPITWHTPTIAQMDKIPLYTHQAKTLTDEEIWEVINRTAWVGTEEEIRFKIAEAILRKAQEK